MDSPALCLCHSIPLSLQPDFTALSCTLYVPCDHRAFPCAAPSVWDTAFPICQLVRRWRPTPVLLPWESRGLRSLVGFSPWGLEESDTTERLHFHFSLSCIGEENGNPFRCSCMENPRDGGAWWVAIYGVTQSRIDWSDLAAAATSSSYPLPLSQNIASSGKLPKTGQDVPGLHTPCTHPSQGELLYLFCHRPPSAALSPECGL